MVELVLTSQGDSTASVHQVSTEIHATKQEWLINAPAWYVYMVADVAILETKASVSVLKVTMENIVSWKLTGVNHLLVVMVLHVLIMVTWCFVSVQSGLSGDTVKKVGGKFFLWCFPLISRVANDNAKARGTDWMRLSVLILLLCHWSSSFKICAPCHYCCHVFISKSVCLIWQEGRPKDSLRCLKCGF